MKTTSILGVTYAFPDATRTIAELADAGLLVSDAAVLQGFGFDRVHVSDRQSPYELAHQAARALLEQAGVDPDRVGLLVYTGIHGPRAFRVAGQTTGETGEPRAGPRFRFPATRLQYDLGLSGSSVLGVDQLGGTGLFGAIRVARALCLSEGIEFALCVSSEFCPPGSLREATFSCLSDAACAVLVGRSGDRNRIVAAAHRTRGYLWDADHVSDAIVGAYFPTATEVIRTTLADAGWTTADVDWVIPHNVAIQSWEVLMRLSGLSNARVWSRNVPRDGRTASADNLINLRDALQAGSVAPGDRVLLFSFGYGAHWTALAMEV